MLFLIGNLKVALEPGLCVYMAMRVQAMSESVFDYLCDNRSPPTLELHQDECRNDSNPEQSRQLWYFTHSPAGINS